MRPTGYLAGRGPDQCPPLADSMAALQVFGVRVTDSATVAVIEPNRIPPHVPIRPVASLRRYDGGALVLRLLAATTRDDLTVAAATALRLVRRQSWAYDGSRWHRNIGPQRRWLSTMIYRALADYGPDLALVAGLPTSAPIALTTQIAARERTAL